MCSGQPRVLSDQDYHNIFVLLKQDNRGNVSFEYLMAYLKTVYDFSDKAILTMLQNSADKDTDFLNERQFIQMMKQINGIDKNDTYHVKHYFTIMT